MATARRHIASDAKGIYSTWTIGLAKPGSRMYTVAEAKAVTGAYIFLEALPAFNATKTAVTLVFRLSIQFKNGAGNQITVPASVVNRALKANEDPIAAAFANRAKWIAANWPAEFAIIDQAMLARTTPMPAAGQPAKTMKTRKDTI